MSECKPDPNAKNVHCEMINGRVVVVPNGMSTATFMWIMMNEEFEKIRAASKVIVMHPTCANMMKDRITSSMNRVTLENEYRYDGKHRLFLSPYLPKDHFTIMELGQYEEYKKKGEL